MRGIVKSLIGVVVLVAFSAAAMAAATNHWQLDGDVTDAVGTAHGSPQGGVGNYSMSAAVADVAIYDPLSASTRANTGSALFTNPGGSNYTNSGINVGTLAVMDSFWKPYTVEAIFKGPAGQAEEATLFGRWLNTPDQSNSQFYAMGFTGTPDDIYAVMAANGWAGAVYAPSSTEPVTDDLWHHAAITYWHEGETWSVASDPAPTFTLHMSIWVDYQFVNTSSIQWTGYLQRGPDPYDHLPSTGQGHIGGNRGAPVLNNVNIDEMRILDYAVPDGANGLDHFLQPVPEPATMSLLGIGALAMLRRRRR